MKAGPGSKASPKSRQRNKRVHKTIIFFTMQTNKVRDLIAVYYNVNGLSTIHTKRKLARHR